MIAEALPYGAGNRHVLARALLALFSLLQGVMSLAVDLRRTHATNPTWPGHARFHLLWQNMAVVLLAIFAVAIVCWPAPYPETFFFLGVALTAIPLLAFLCALAIRKRYAATLSDPNGVPPVTMVVAGKIRQVDLNLVVVAVALCVLAGISALYGW